MSDIEGSEIVVVGARIAQGNQVSFSSGNYYMTGSSSFFSSQSDYSSGLFGSQYHISIDVPAPTNEEGDIVVEASREQVDAAKLAYEAAGINIGIAQIMGIIGAGMVSKGFAIGLAVTDKLVDFNADDLQAAYADLLYYQDGADGTYDGYADDYGDFRGFNNRDSGPGPHVPMMPDDGMTQPNYQYFNEPNDTLLMV